MSEDEKKPKKTLEEKIIEDIRKSGYPLEIEISSLLTEKWLIFNNEYYIDKNTDKEREIDILAVYSRGYDFDAEMNLVIECKKSNTHAWVFFPLSYFRSLWKRFSVLSDSAQYFDSVKVGTRGKESLINEKYTSTLSDKPSHYDTFEKRATVYYECKIAKLEKGQESGKSEVYEAVNQLRNFVTYRLERELINYRKAEELKVKRPSLQVYFPIIVFDGKLYECTIEVREPKLEESNHILLHYPLPGSEFFIDVVKREYFEDFIKLIINEEKKRIFGN